MKNKDQERNKTLTKAGIKHYDVSIHDQSREWLIENFHGGAKAYPINVACLMRNIIWQTRERIIKQEKPLLKELIRTFWYMYIKPTLSRAESLTSETDQYDQLIDNLVYMVKDLKIMEYKDIGFRDDKQSNRKIGKNANIILFSEKLGHQEFLSEMANIFDVSILALGGQPSVLNVEYFVDTLKAAKFRLESSFYLFSIVDYDPSGWIVKNAFIDDLKHYGIKNIRCEDLITPDMLTIDEIMLARYHIPDSQAMKNKNEYWLSCVKAKNYKHQAFLEETKGHKKTLYGLEAESVSGKRIAKKLKEVMLPRLGKDENLLKRYELKKLDEEIKKLILRKITG
jgi:hypothetical protein